jgi:peptidoglycan/LPS O-acetylase OafA/YrhL
VAILLVLFGHATNGWVFTAGPSPWKILEKPEWFFHFIICNAECGVAIFFVVSGFCIHLSFQKLKSWPVFFVKRFFRIYPPYLAALLFFAFLFPYCNLNWISDESPTKVFVQHLFMVNNYREGMPLVLNPSFWSVATEVQLYILYPMVVFFSCRFGWDKTLIFLGFLEVGLRLFEIVNGNLYGLAMSPFKFWFSWSIGAYVCQRWIEGKSTIFSNQSFILWCILCIIPKFFGQVRLFEFTLVAITTAIFISKRLNGLIKFKIPCALGTIISKIGIYSYGIYLLHQPFFWFSQYLEVQTTPRLNARLEAWFSVAIPEKIVTLFWCVFICLVIYFLCAFFYRFVERPSVNLGNWVIKFIR